MINLPSGWKRQTLEDVAEVTMGQSPPGSSYNETGKGTAFFQGKAEFGDVYPTVKKFTTAGTKFAKQGDILMSVRAPVGPTNIAGIDCVIGRGLAAIRAKDSITQDYLKWTLKHLEIEIQGKGNGTTFDSISGDALRETVVALPPIPEQHQIVEILEDHLSRLDAALADVKQVREKAAQFRRSLLQAIFQGDYSESTSPYQEWGVASLNDLVDSTKDFVDGPFGSNLKTSHYRDSGAKVIRLQNIGQGKFIKNDAFINQEHFNTLQKHSVKEGDLLFASLGDELPRTCLTPDLGGNAVVKADCIRVRLSETINSKWVLYSTMTPIAKVWALSQLHGLGRARLGLTAIRNFPVPLPSRTEQDRLVGFMEAEFSKVNAVDQVSQTAAREAEALRRSLLQAAFTGQLTRVTSHV